MEGTTTAGDTAPRMKLRERMIEIYITSIDYLLNLMCPSNLNIQHGFFEIYPQQIVTRCNKFSK